MEVLKWKYFPEAGKNFHFADWMHKKSFHETFSGDFVDFFGED